ncbi:hypothetical protein DSO57_1011014 [Entomophthora muscae]|uniref:Uncharacterized protein n=1 Tax=Entomophthora muscae TaxID=34485 RepID=A0ACC2S8D8_9FUNG|nr:hypothetical protein DSO57_1011014 [Entomophthora muscae]
MRAMARVNNYQSMIHELSKQVLEKEERAQEALAEQEVLLKQIKRVGRHNRKRNNSSESLDLAYGHSSTTPPGITNVNRDSLEPEKASAKASVKEEKEEKVSDKSSASSAKDGKFWKPSSRVMDITSIILPPTEAPGDYAGATLLSEPSQGPIEPSIDELNTILSQPLVDEPKNIDDEPEIPKPPKSAKKPKKKTSHSKADKQEQVPSQKTSAKEVHNTMTRKAYTSEKKRRLSMQPLATPAEQKTVSKRKSGQYISAEPEPLAKPNQTLRHSSIVRERRRKSMQLREIRVAQAESRLNTEQHAQLPHSPSSFFDSEGDDNPPLAPALSHTSLTLPRITVKSEDRYTSSANRVASRPRQAALTPTPSKPSRKLLNATPSPQQAVNRPSTTRKPMANPNSSREALGRALSIIPPPRPPPDEIYSFHTAPSGTKYRISRPNSQVFPPIVDFSAPPEFIIPQSKSQSDLRLKPPT